MDQVGLVPLKYLIEDSEEHFKAWRGGSTAQVGVSLGSECATRSLWRSSLGLLILCMTRCTGTRPKVEKVSQMGQIETIVIVNGQILCSG